MKDLVIKLIYEKAGEEVALVPKGEMQEWTSQVSCFDMGILKDCLTPLYNRNGDWGRQWPEVQTGISC
jgi:hypothetical protein